MKSYQKPKCPCVCMCVPISSWRDWGFGKDVGRGGFHVGEDVNLGRMSVWGGCQVGVDAFLGACGKRALACAQQQALEFGSHSTP